VQKRAVKACDTIGNSGMHRMDNAVHLAASRCDGQAHGGCQAGCLLYWKEAWLQRVQLDAEALADGEPDPGQPTAGPVDTGAEPCTLATLTQATRVETPDSDEEVFACQATEMPNAAPVHLAGWDPRQYVRDVTSGNVRPLSMMRSLLIHLFNQFQWANHRFLPSLPLIHGAKRYPFLEGRLEGRTPKETLNLQPGEFVVVKSKEEILQTLDKQERNRGLRFHNGRLKYCGSASGSCAALIRSSTNGPGGWCTSGATASSSTAPSVPPITSSTVPGASTRIGERSGYGGSTALVVGRSLPRDTAIADGAPKPTDHAPGAAGVGNFVDTAVDHVRAQGNRRQARSEAQEFDDVMAPEDPAIGASAIANHEERLGLPVRSPLPERGRGIRPEPIADGGVGHELGAEAHCSSSHSEVTILPAVQALVEAANGIEDKPSEPEPSSV
jgi:hypothetical protein